MCERRGLRGSGDESPPPGVVQGKAPVWGMEADAFFVNEYLNFVVLEEEKSVKRPNIPS